MNKIKILFFLFLAGFCFLLNSSSFCQELSKDKTKFLDSTGKEWDVVDPEVIKIKVNEDTNIDDSKKLAVKEALKGKIHKEALVAKNDYVGEFDRGTVYFNEEKGNKFDPDALKMRNYSFHKVIIPDGTTVDGVNFSQKEPHTDAIEGENLTFKNCNLKNIEIHDSWTLENSLSVHAREREEEGFYIYEVEKDGKFKEVIREEISSEYSDISE